MFWSSWFDNGRIRFDQRAIRKSEKNINNNSEGIFYKNWNEATLLKSEKKFLFISFNESPIKKMKNPFYSILKALFVLKIFKFLSSYLGQVEETA